MKTKWIYAEPHYKDIESRIFDVLETIVYDDGMAIWEIKLNGVWEIARRKTEATNDPPTNQR